MKPLIRAVDGGGEGFRRADVIGTEITNPDQTRGSLSNLDSLLDFVSQDLSSEVRGISYAMAGVNVANQVMLKSPNAHFLDGINLASETTKRTGLPALIFNDMEAAVAGMATLLPDEPYFMGITWSSGIGLQVWNDGRILSLAEGGHSHLDLSPFAPLCGCGKRGHVEAAIGGKAVRRRVIAETEALGIDLPPIDPCRFLDDSFKQNKPWAVEIYQIIAYGMGTFLATLQSILHLPLVVWKGTFALKALPLIELEIRKVMGKQMIDPSWATSENLRFLFSPDPGCDSLVGAASCLQQCLEM